MPIGEAAFSYTGKDSKQNLCTIRGGTWDEFANNIAEAVGPDADTVLALFAAAFGGAPPTPPQAVAAVTQAFPGAVPVPMTVPAAAPPQAAPAVPVAPPVQGPACVHGARVYREMDRSTAERPNNLWKFWECAAPYVRGGDNSQRCKAVTVK